MTDASWRPFALRLFARARSGLLAAADGLTAPALGRRPALAPGANSVGRLVRHVARGQDRNVSEMRRVVQLWVSDGWAERFGRPADPADTGFGHTREEATAFRVPEPQVLFGYEAAAHARLVEFLEESGTDPAAVRVSPTPGDSHTVEERPAGLLRECFAHAGQAALLRDRDSA